MPLSQAFEREGALLRLRLRPGTRSSYSNMGYALQGSSTAYGSRYQSPDQLSAAAVPW